MSAGVWFWIIYVLCVIAGFFFAWPGPAPAGSSWSWRPIGWPVVVLILLGLLGWKTFGAPLQ